MLDRTKLSPASPVNQWKNVSTLLDNTPFVLFTAKLSKIKYTAVNTVACASHAVTSRSNSRSLGSREGDSPVANGFVSRPAHSSMSEGRCDAVCLLQTSARAHQPTCYARCWRLFPGECRATGVFRGQVECTFFMIKNPSSNPGSNIMLSHSSKPAVPNLGPYTCMCMFEG